MKKKLNFNESSLKLVTKQLIKTEEVNWLNAQ